MMSTGLRGWTLRLRDYIKIKNFLCSFAKYAELNIVNGPLVSTRR